MRTVYLGTSEFAARVLRRLADSQHRPSLVVAPPDRPRGRGRKLAAPPVADAARELGIELLQSANVNDSAAVEAIGAQGAEYGVLCAFGQLIGPDLLAGPPILNIHPSLLPRWRGAAPIERALMAGDDETGVTVMRVGEGLDSGPIALRDSLTVAPGEDFGALSDRLAELGGEMIVRALDAAAAGELEFAEQPEEGVTYAEKVGAEDRQLDPSRPAIELERRVRALTPHVGAYVQLADDERLGVRRAVADEAGPKPGEFVHDAEGDALLLGCADGALRIERVQPAGKREMDATEYLRGHAIPHLAE